MGQSVSAWRKTEIKSWNERERKRLDIAIENESRKMERNLNIVLLGKSGSGKSYFINSIFSAFAGHLKSKVNTNKQTGESTTIESRNYVVKPKVVFHDVKSMRGESDSKTLLSENGLIHLIKTGKFDLDPEIEYNMNRHHTFMDAVVVVVKIDKEYMDNYNIMTCIINAANHCEVPVFVMITHIDTFVDELNTNSVFEEPKFRDNVEKLSTILRIDENKILLQSNYSGKDQVCDVCKDILTLYNLWYIITNLN